MALVWQRVNPQAFLPNALTADVPLVRGVMEPTRNLPVEAVRDMKRVYTGFLYDTASFTAINGAIAASRKLQFFTQGLGQGVSPVYGTDVKTEVDTNMRVSGGQLSSRQSFIADGLGFQIFPQLATSINDGAVSLDNFTTTTPFQYMLNDAQAILNGFLALYGSGSTSIILGVLSDWPFGGGVNGFTAGVGPSQDMAFGAYVNNGSPEKDARNRFDIPKDFSEGEDFRVNSTNPNVIPSLITAAGDAQTPVRFGWVVKASYFGGWLDRI